MKLSFSFNNIDKKKSETLIFLFQGFLFMLLLALSLFLRDSNSIFTKIVMGVVVTVLVVSFGIWYKYFGKEKLNVLKFLKRVKSRMPNVKPIGTKVKTDDVKKKFEKKMETFKKVAAQPNHLKEIPLSNLAKTFPKKKGERRELYRELSRRLQQTNNFAFTKSMLLNALETTYGSPVVEDRIRYLEEISDWLDEDNYASIIRNENAVKFYRVI